MKRIALIYNYITRTVINNFKNEFLIFIKPIARLIELVFEINDEIFMSDVLYTVY